jgi:hypothetical protein
MIHLEKSKGPKPFPTLLDNVNNNPAAIFDSSGFDDGTNGIRNFTLLTDNFAHIFGSNSQLKMNSSLGCILATIT